MKKQLLGFLLGVMLVFGCVGCGAENTTTEPTATVTETTTEESTPEQTEAPTATPEETVEPTPEATEEPSEETTAETEPETEPTEASEAQVTYTYTDMSATMYAQQTVNFRDLPDTSGNKLGSLSTNDEIQISGQCNETGWYRFEYNGSTAFVSNKYVGENKVEVQTASNSSTTSTASTTSGKKNWYDYYSDHVWYDSGSNYMFIIVDDYQDGFNTDYSYPTSVLNERYPGEFVYLRSACELRDGHWMFFATAGVSYDLEPFMNQFK